MIKAVLRHAEPQECPVAEIHDSLDARGDQHRRRGDDLHRAFTEHSGAGAADLGALSASYSLTLSSGGRDRGSHEGR
jgi:hypothetical protein